jgi:hypothetical protein
MDQLILWVGSFKCRYGKWMCEDNNMDLKRSALEYFMAAFLPKALKRILFLTNKSLQKNEGKEIEFGRINLVLWNGSID